MVKDDEKRLVELQSEQIRLQAQGYLIEHQLLLIAAAIGEHTIAEAKKPKPEEKPPDA